MYYAHKGSHVDGTWFHVFNSVEDVLSDMAKYVQSTAILENIRYIDTNGGVHIYFAIPDGFGADDLSLIYEAWDNIECGLSNSSYQDELINRWERWVKSDADSLSCL